MYLLFDIGGTKFRHAVSQDGVTLGEAITHPTPAGYQGMIKAFEDIAKGISGKGLRSVVIGIAGSQDAEHTRVLRSKNLPQVEEKPLKEDAERVFGVPVILRNDAVLAGIGEARRGAGKGYSLVVYMTVSTGVGGVRIVDGVPDESAKGSEPGKQIIEKGMTIEQLVSGGDVQKRYGDPRKIQDEKIWDELARYLAIGLNNTIVHWSPEIVVLGGSMILGNPSIPLESVKKYLKETLTIFPEPPMIKKAALGDNAGLYGALEVARSHV